MSVIELCGGKYEFHLVPTKYCSMCSVCISMIQLYFIFRLTEEAGCRFLSWTN